MARSLWIKMVMAAFASGGVALGQSADAPPAASARPAERIITVQEGGKPAQKCRVVKSWKMNDGNTALQVEALDTGETMTIVEERSGPAPSGPGGRVRTMTTRIFHWGPSKSPPPGVPVAPPTAVVHQPAGPVGGLAVRPTAAPQSPVSSYATAPDAQRTWPPAHGTGPEAVAGRTAPATPPPTPPAVRPASGTASPAVTQAAPVSKPVSPPPPPVASRPAPATPPVMAKPAPSQPPMVIHQTENNERGLFARLFQRDNTPRTAAGEKIVPVPPGASPYSPTAAMPGSSGKMPPPSPARTEVVQAQPKDWRESWGRVEAPKIDAAKTEMPKEPAQPQPVRSVSSAPKEAPRPLPIKPISQPTDLPKPIAPRTLPELPRVDTKKPDPLQEPANYSNYSPTPVEPPRPPAPMPETKPVRPIETPKPPAPRPETKPVTMATPPPAPMPETRPVKPVEMPKPPAPMPETKPISKAVPLPPPTRTAAPPKAMAAAEQPMPAAPPPVMTAPERPVPLGAASVLAAGDVQYVPVPVVTVPNITRLPAPPPANVPNAPQPNEAMFTNAFTPSAPAPAAPMPAQMANAFMSSPSGSEGMTYHATAFSPAAPAPMGSMVPSNAYAMAARGMNPARSQAMQSASMPDVQQTLALLRDSLYPSQREWAAERLAASRGMNNPHIVHTLLTAAKDDPAASVRAACVRSLAKMDASTLPVIQALEAMKADPDAAVRREVEQALYSLTPGKAATGVQPVGATMPARP